MTFPNFWKSNNLISTLLLPFSYVWILGSYLRHQFAKQTKLPFFVINVGNCIIGGSGKTQLVIYLAKLLIKLDIDHIVVCKSYKGKLAYPKIVTKDDSPEIVGDEPKEISLFTKVISTPSIYKAIKILQKISVKVVIIDDGMQNPYIYKDLNILVMDGERHLGNNRIIPAGPLRQSLASALENTDIILTIGGNNIARYRYPSQHFVADIIDKNNDKPKGKWLAFAGIGNPDRFFALLKKYNYELIYTKIFPDHHKYTKKDIQNLNNTSKKFNARLITTRKDYIKLYDKMKLDEYIVELSIRDNRNFDKFIYEKILNAKINT